MQFIWLQEKSPTKTDKRIIWIWIRVDMEQCIMIADISMHAYRTKLSIHDPYLLHETICMCTTWLLFMYVWIAKIYRTRCVLSFSSYRNLGILLKGLGNKILILNLKFLTTLLCWNQLCWNQLSWNRLHWNRLHWNRLY